MNASKVQPTLILPTIQNGPIIRKNVYGLMRYWPVDPTRALRTDIMANYGEAMGGNPETDFFVYDFINGKLVKRNFSTRQTVVVWQCIMAS